MPLYATAYLKYHRKWKSSCIRDRLSETRPKVKSCSYTIPSMWNLQNSKICSYTRPSLWNSIESKKLHLILTPTIILTPTLTLTLTLTLTSKGSTFWIKTKIKETLKRDNYLQLFRKWRKSPTPDLLWKSWEVMRKCLYTRPLTEIRQKMKKFIYTWPLI